MVIKFVPGFVAAIVAYSVSRLIGWIEGFWFKFFIFLIVYLIGAIALDIAMTRYGGSSPDK